MSNILIPTDFTAASIDAITDAMGNVRGKCNIVLFHAFDMPESLVDAIRRSGISGHGNLITEQLRIRCKKIKAANPRVESINFRIMYGSTIYAFRNFVEANMVDTIFIPADYRFRPVVRESVDPTNWFARAGLRIIEVSHAQEMRPIGIVSNSHAGKYQSIESPVNEY